MAKLNFLQSLYQISWVLILIGVLVAIAGCFIFIKEWKQTKFVKVQGTIIESGLNQKVERSTGEAGSRLYWKLSVRYTYEYHGVHYTSERVGNHDIKERTDIDTPPSVNLYEKLLRNEKGFKIDVWVSPTNPKIAMLFPAKSPNWYLLAAGLLIVLATFYFRKVAKI